MSVTALDSRVLRNIFGTQEVRDVFSDDAYVRYMVETEAALARAESSVGVIPEQAGRVITEATKHLVIDFDRLSTETDIVGYPVLPLIRQMVENMPAEVDKYIHWGATTQDIMDCASMLQMKHGLEIVKRQLRDLVAVLRLLAKQHRDTPMAGRTHLQHALPCTFGYKCAVYLSGMLRHLERLQQIEDRCLFVQFGGAAGTLASLGPDDVGLRVREALAVELRLKAPPVTWHVVRDNVAEILNFLALVAGSLGKIAYDVIVMSSNEFGELAEPFVSHRGASSTMPQKRNPISSEVILATSKLVRANASLGLDAMVVEFERAAGPWHLEWVAIPEAFVLTVGALHQTNFVISGMSVDTGSMMANLRSTRGLIVGEAVMMGLAPFLGRQQAHDVVYAACREAIETGEALLDVLKRRPAVMEKVGGAKLTQLCDPTEYLGASQLMVDTMVASSHGSTTSLDNGSNGSKLNGNGTQICMNGLH